MRSAPHPNCIVCGSVGRSAYRDLNDRMFSAPGKWSIDRCSNTACGTLWLNPAPVPEDLGEAYRGYFTHVAKTNPRLSSLKRAYLTTRYAENGARGIMDRLGAAVFALRFRRRMEADDQAAHTRKPKGKAVFLDVGCGSGDAMWLLGELGWETIGVEFDAEAVAAARSRGLTVHEGDLLDQKLETGLFDAVQLSHVVEHLPDPVATLKECHRILKPGGVLIMLTPNAEGLTHSLFGTNWMALDPPRHLNIFTVASMRSLLGQAGFGRHEVTSSASGADRIATMSLAIRGRGHAEGGENPSWLHKRAGRFLHAVESLATLFSGRVGDQLVVRARKGRA